MQLGVKVPLWGGFSAHGGFALKLWTQKAKMDKEQWAGHIPALRGLPPKQTIVTTLAAEKHSGCVRVCFYFPTAFVFSWGCFVIPLRPWAQKVEDVA